MQGCVVCPRFLSEDDAAALLSEFEALSDERDVGAAFAGGGASSSASESASAWLASQSTSSSSSSTGRYNGPSVFGGSEAALCNQAIGRQFFNMSVDEATGFQCPTLSKTIDAMAALTERLSAYARGGGTWWSADVRAPTRSTIQRYPPGARYDEHTDSHHIGDGWQGPRSFTALVYAHPGWSKHHGGERIVRSPGYAPRQCDYDPTVAGRRQSWSLEAAHWRSFPLIAYTR